MKELCHTTSEWKGIAQIKRFRSQATLNYFSLRRFHYCIRKLNAGLSTEYTGCGRKNSPIWEANKFKTKEDTANVFVYFWKVHRMPFYTNVF